MPFVGQLAPGIFVLVEIEAHRAQHMRRLGELDIGVFDHLDPIAPGIEKVEELSRQQFAARGLDPRAYARAIVDDEPEMTAPVLVRISGLHHIDELVAELDESIARPLGPKLEVEDLAVKIEGLLDVPDLDRDVIDADKSRLASVGLAGLAHMSFLLVAAKRTDYNTASARACRVLGAGRRVRPGDL